MKIRDFIKLEEDIDVYDDVTDDGIAIAFCGALGLTEEGEKHFAEVLDYEIEICRDPYNPCAIVNIDGEKWKSKLRKAQEFFYSAAGYCPADDWDKWFI